MPDRHDAVPVQGRIDPGPPEPSRRSVLRGSAAGAAGIATAALAGGGLPAASSTGTTARPARAAGAEASEPVVVHVRDAAAGEMDVFRGTTHTRVRDKELAARLVGASG
jgi:hypothetical protein